MSFNDSKFIESKNATISASSKTGVWEDSRTSLGGLALYVPSNTLKNALRDTCRWVAPLQLFALIWCRPDVIGLFSNNVVSLSRNVVLRRPSFSINVVRKSGCFRAAFMFSGRYSYPVTLFSSLVCCTIKAPENACFWHAPAELR
jgi:hypothetical protein